MKDVYSSTPAHDDVQQSFFLAETLKYVDAFFKFFILGNFSRTFLCYVMINFLEELRILMPSVRDT